MKDYLTEDAPSEPAAPSAAAERMRLYRKRKRDGLLCVNVQLRVTEVDELVSRGLLTSEMRNDRVAIADALHEHFDVWLRPPP